MENLQITHECVKSISNIGSTTYQNICNGTLTVVPWGALDYTVMIIIGLFVTMLSLWILLEIITC